MVTIKKLYSNRFWEIHGKTILDNIPNLFKFHRTTVMYYPFITARGMEDIRKAFKQSKEEDKILKDYYMPLVDMRHSRWKRILDIQKAVNDRVVCYVPDIDGKKQLEYWKPPIMTHLERHGDCDDEAVLMCYVLRLLGLTEWEVFVSVGYVYKIGGEKGEYHAYCVAFNEYNGRFMPLEGTWYEDKSRTEAFANAPIWEENKRYAQPDWITNDVKTMSKSMLPFKFVR